MPSLTPDSSTSLPVYYLRKAVAGSATFQSWTGTASELLALARVHEVELNVETVDLVPATDLPLACVDMDAEERSPIAGGSRTFFEGTGTLKLMFRARVTEAAASDASKEFTNKVGRIIDEIEARAGTAGYLDVTSIRRSDGPWRPSPQEAQQLGYDFYQVSYEVGYRSI